MKLTSYTNYAMRSLQPAALKSPDLVHTDNVAQLHKESRPHIKKTQHDLGNAGYLETVWSRNGSFCLARPTEETVDGEVVRLAERPLDVVEGFNPQKNTCLLTGICILSRKIQQATAAFMAVLDDLTVAGIAANIGQLMDRIATLELPRPETATT